MDELKTMIRLAKHQLDEKRKVLATLESEVARVEGEKAALLALLARELEGAASLPDGRQTLGAFIRASHAKRDVFDQQLRDLACLVARALDDVRQAFEILKRYEVASEQRAQVERRENLRRETKVLDEVGSEVSRRRGQAGHSGAESVYGEGTKVKS